MYHDNVANLFYEIYSLIDQEKETITFQEKKALEKRIGNLGVKISYYRENMQERMKKEGFRYVKEDLTEVYEKVRYEVRSRIQKKEAANVFAKNSFNTLSFSTTEESCLEHDSNSRESLDNSRQYNVQINNRSPFYDSEKTSKFYVEKKKSRTPLLKKESISYRIFKEKMNKKRNKIQDQNLLIEDLDRSNKTLKEKVCSILEQLSYQEKELSSLRSENMELERTALEQESELKKSKWTIQLRNEKLSQTEMKLQAYDAIFRAKDEQLSEKSEEIRRYKNRLQGVWQNASKYR